MKRILKNIHNLFLIVFNKIILKKPDFSEKRIFLQGEILDSINKKKEKIKDFSDVEFSVFSQFGEDGIISWLTHKIPNIEKIFLEIGTQDYWESNTRYLLKSKMWKGYIIEGSTKDVNKIKSQKIYWQNDLKAINEFISEENINTIINKKVNHHHLGLLSIDIDGNDYWILKKINLNADIIVAEYNPIFGDIYKISVPYDKNFIRNKKHFSNLFFGCSINALIDLMEKKNYVFLGTNSQGMNAFFINRDKFNYLEGKISHTKIFPPMIREGRNTDGKLNFKSLNENFKFISDFEVYDIDNKKNKKLSNYENLYSEKWKKVFSL